MKYFIWLFSGLTILFLVAAAKLFGIPKNVDWNLFKFLSTIVMGEGFIWWLFFKWAWVWRIWQGWLVPFPNLNGTWKGKIHSNWINPATGERIDSIPARLEVKQSFKRITCQLITAESISKSSSECFEIEPDSGAKQLVFSYQNEPKPSVKERSEPHEGTAKIRIIGKKKIRLEGKYWNDRAKPVSGELEFNYWESDSYSKKAKTTLRHPMKNK